MSGREHASRRLRRPRAHGTDLAKSLSAVALLNASCSKRFFYFYQFFFRFFFYSTLPGMRTRICILLQLYGRGGKRRVSDDDGRMRRGARGGAGTKPLMCFTCQRAREDAFAHVNAYTHRCLCVCVSRQVFAQ